MLAATVMLHHRLGIGTSANKILILMLIYVLSFLMVSSIKFHSFKKPELFKKMNFNYLVAAVLIMIFIAAQPAIALFSIGLAYIMSGPFGFLRKYKALKKKKAESRKKDEHRSNQV